MLCTSKPVSETDYFMSSTKITGAGQCCRKPAVARQQLHFIFIHTLYNFY